MKFISLISPLPLDSDPGIANDGEFYFNSSSNIYRYFYSGSWASLLNSINPITNYLISTVVTVGSEEIANISFTLEADELGKTLFVTSASHTYIFIPEAPLEEVPIGSSVKVIRGGPGKISFVATGLNDILFPSEHYLTARYSTATLLKIDDHIWSLSGEFPDIY